MSLAAEEDDARGHRQEAQRAALKHMKRTATGLLVAMLLLYIACTIGKAHAPWLGYPAAFAEAATVGACADWFAVTALFRHPFGMPIPHTAILPRNQRRLAESAGVFIAGNFLAASEVAPRLQRIDVAGWIGTWLKRPEHADLVVEYGRALVSSAIEAAHDPEIRETGGKLIRKGLESVAAAPMAGRILVLILERGYDKGLYDFAVEKAAAFLADNHTSLREKASERRSGWLGSWFDSKAADAFIMALQDSLAEATAPEHPWRRSFHDFLANLVVQLAEDPEIYALCERFKSDLLSADLVDQVLEYLSGEAETRLELDGAGVTHAMSGTMAAVGRWLEQDERVREMINRLTREAILNTLVPNRAEIGAFVTDVITRWDSATLVERFELHVGRDLQFIRINGAVVGGCVGLLIYTATQLVGR
jgi:uncharacterized membrane-anchored protein YjiN (DUF445 family)